MVYYLKVMKKIIVILTATLINLTAKSQIPFEPSGSIYDGNNALSRDSLYYKMLLENYQIDTSKYELREMLYSTDLLQSLKKKSKRRLYKLKINDIWEILSFEKFESGVDLPPLNKYIFMYTFDFYKRGEKILYVEIY